MNPLSQWLQLPQSDLIGWWILHSLWEGALVAAVFGLLRVGLRKHSAGSRYVVGCIALVITVLAPLITLVAWGNVHRSELPRSVLAEAAPSNLSTSADSYAGGADRTTTLGAVGATAARIAPHLSIFWALGVLVGSIRLGRSCWCVHQLKAGAKEPVALCWVAMMERLRTRLQISRPVRLFQSALVNVPTVVGWLRPMILLPAATLAGLTPQQVEAILAHELAHVRRFDYLVNALQCLIETLMFYHPAVWWISRCIREEREHCCDDLALEMCSNRLNYARALAWLEGARAEFPSTALAATGGSLLGRIQRLFAGPVARPAPGRHFVGLLLVIVGLLMLLLGSCLSLVRPQFSATARIKLATDGRKTSGETTAGTSPAERLSLIQELVVIRSEFVLGRVVANLDLVHRWNPNPASESLTTNRAILLLRDRLDLRLADDSPLVEIDAVSADPNEAAALANAVADAYRGYRLEQVQHQSRRGLDSLEQRFKEQDERIRHKESEISQWRAKLQIPAAWAEEQETPAHNAEVLKRIHQLRIEAKSEAIREETLLKHLRSLTTQQIIEAMPTAVPDSLLNSLIEQKNLAEQALLTLRIDYAEEHPEVVKASRRLKDLNEKVGKRVEGIFMGLEQRLASTKEALLNLEREIEEAGERNALRYQQWQPYYQAKRELEELRRFLQILNLKIASERIDLALPLSTPPVQILDTAVAPARPTVPNRRQGAALCLLGFIFDLTGFILLRAKSGKIEPQV